MHHYHEILTQQDLDALGKHVHGFHDSMIKEFRIFNRAFVQADHSMVMSQRYDGQLLIHSQWPPHAIEFVFSKVIEVRLHEPNCVFGGGVSFELTKAQKPSSIRLSFDTSAVVAERVFFANRSEWLGPKARFGPEMPSVDSVESHVLEGKWRQCATCSDAWEEELSVVYSLCPACGRLTELVHV